MSSQIIQAKVRKILTHFKVTEAPVPVEQIAEKMNIQISYAPSVEYSGILIRKNGGALMGINTEESPARRRFTIAHELGHFFLESTTAVSIDYRDNNNRPDKTIFEKRADDFAANLLMPKQLLLNDFRKLDGSYEDRLIELSEQYQVSREAMMWRLKNLNLR
ncbi:MAG TPA: ImmA/IrrE family metallo-endopeptidase [Candidatus Udaeobacter sp.]|nr:ImmA/IrrE family metallo-endopeptidase [Candidatus Udaeobacter sp.]